MEASVSIDDGECLISFDSYQSIPEDTIESIKTIGRDYCYQADSEPTNTVSGKIAIISDSEELAGITSSIDSELTEFGVDLKKDESGEFLLTSDKDIVFLQKIVDTHHKGIAEVVCTTKDVYKRQPHFSAFIYDMLPPFLKEVLGNCISEDDRDMMLMGTLTCISATLHNVVGEYNHDDWHPML